MQALKGAATAAAIREQIAQEVQALSLQGVQVQLAVLRVGEKPDDIAYENSVVKKCAQAHIQCRQVTLPHDSTTQQCVAAMQQLSEDRSVHGILLLRPLPQQIDEEAVIAHLAVDKDVDGMTPLSLAKVFMGDPSGFAPCTAESVLRILQHEQIPMAGKEAVVVGRSMVVGRPVAMLLLHENATVTLCHTRTRDLAQVCRRADILVAAAGQRQMIDAAYIKPGAVVCDVGIHVDANGKLCGDVNAAQAAEAALLTPVPGGVGNVTSWLLIEHVVHAAQRMQRGEE